MYACNSSIVVLILLIRPPMRNDTCQNIVCLKDDVNDCGICSTRTLHFFLKTSIQNYYYPFPVVFFSTRGRVDYLHNFLKVVVLVQIKNPMNLFYMYLYGQHCQVSRTKSVISASSKLLIASYLKVSHCHTYLQKVLKK